MKENVDVAYLDFAKAFDKVDFNVLLNKLHKIGIRGNLLSWVKSFLTDRTMYVVIGGVMSLPCLVKSGVPQGSVLGPLLFLIMMLDIDQNVTQSSVKSFADDTRLLKSISNEDDINALSNDLSSIYQWAIANNLEFNNSKFELMQYGNDDSLKLTSAYKSSSDSSIDKVDKVSDLGVWLSSDASFKYHVDQVCSSAKKIISWIYRTFNSRSVKCMSTLWKSLVLPKIEYCSQLWCPFSKQDIEKIELLQRHFVRKIRLNSNFNYWETLVHLNLFSLQRRRERYRVIYTWKIMENLVPNISFSDNRKIIVQYTARFGRKCIVPSLQRGRSRVSTLYEHSLAVCGPKLFNVLPQYIRDLTSCTVETFKTNLDKFLWTIPDEPVISGYTHGNNQRHGSNSLIDILS